MPAPTISQIVNGLKVAGKVAGAVANIAPIAAPVIMAGVKKATGAGSGAKAKLDARSAERLARKEERERQATAAALESASKELDVMEFEELWTRWGLTGKLDALSYIAGPGCFVIMTFLPGAGSDASSDLAGVRGYHIGSGEVMGTSVHEQLSGKGNPDVYADYKYGQDMEVLFFPCLSDDFVRVERLLAGAFPREKSYDCKEDR